MHSILNLERVQFNEDGVVFSFEGGEFANDMFDRKSSKGTRCSRSINGLQRFLQCL